MVVMDCSALAEIALDTQVGETLQQLVVEDERIVAPALLQAELISVIRKSVRKGQITAEEAEGLVARSLELIDQFYPIADLWTESLHEGIRLDHSTYDMFYFVLARRTSATLFTVDKKLADLCWANGVNCIEEIPWPPAEESISMT